MTASFEDTYADLLDQLTADQRRAVIRSATNGVLEGWEPTREEVELHVRAQIENMSAADFTAALAELARRRVRAVS